MEGDHEVPTSRRSQQFLKEFSLWKDTLPADQKDQAKIEGFILSLDPNQLDRFQADVQTCVDSAKDRKKTLGIETGAKRDTAQIEFLQSFIDAMKLRLQPNSEAK